MYCSTFNEQDEVVKQARLQTNTAALKVTAGQDLGVVRVCRCNRTYTSWEPPPTKRCTLVQMSAVCW